MTYENLRTRMKVGLWWRHRNWEAVIFLSNTLTSKILPFTPQFLISNWFTSIIWSNNVFFPFGSPNVWALLIEYLVLFPLIYNTIHVICQEHYICGLYFQVLHLFICCLFLYQYHIVLINGFIIILISDITKCPQFVILFSGVS